MAFAQLTWRESLRNIEVSQSANASKLYNTVYDTTSTAARYRMERRGIKWALLRATARVSGGETPSSAPAQSATGARAWAVLMRAVVREASRPHPAIDAEGWVASARRIPSPNRDARPPGVAISLAVIHGISLPPGQFGGPGIADLFTQQLDPAAHPYYATIAHLRVSSHFLIRRRGELVQFVACGDRAWHAGVSKWKGRQGCNDFSIGIELEGTDTIAYTAAQYGRLAGIIRLLRRHYPLTDVAGHSDIAPGRKTDPGPAFDWDRLRQLLATHATRRIELAPRPRS